MRKQKTLKQKDLQAVGVGMQIISAIYYRSVSPRVVFGPLSLFDNLTRESLNTLQNPGGGHRYAKEVQEVAEFVESTIQKIINNNNGE